MFSLLRGASLVCLALVLASCSESPSTLEVRVVTGLVAGPEFHYVQTILLGPGSAEHRVLANSEAIARFGDDFARGRKVATFALADGEYRVRVRLLRPDGTFLVESTVALNLVSDTVLPVHITRDCVGVVCPAPGGSAAFTSCLAGRCVDPRCTNEAPEFCPGISFCNSAEGCRATASCAESLCDEGVCTERAIADACESDEWCNPDFGAGCEPFTPAAPVPSLCGTICTQPSTPCEFGYWACEEGSEPTCTRLQLRPSDFVCALGRTCDVNGDCVEPSVDLPAINATPRTGLLTTEGGGSASFEIVLATAPSASVFLELTSDDTSEGTVSPTDIEFTPSNWNVPRVVTLLGVDDALSDGSQAYQIRVHVSSSADTAYAALGDLFASALNSDNDSAGVSVTPTSGLVTSEAGDSASFMVVLNSEPTSNVTIALSISDPLEASVVSSVVFTPSNWDTPQTVVVSGVDEFVDDGDAPFTVVTAATSSEDAAYDALAVDDVSGVNTDDDAAGVSVSSVTGFVTTENGAVAQLTMVLLSQPIADVIIPFVSSNTSEGMLDVPSITFTADDWTVPQTVLITGVDDLVSDGHVNYTIMAGPVVSTDLRYDGMTLDNISMVNQDNDTAGVVVTPTAGLITTEAGASASFTVVLTTQPTASVSIALNSSNTMEGTVSPASLTFTSSNWATPQTVTVIGVNDFVLDGYTSYTVVTGDSVSASEFYNGIVVDDVAVTNRNVIENVQASNADPGDFFGHVVAVSADGNTLAVSSLTEASNATGIDGDESNNAASGAGAVYVFTRVGTVWTQQAYVKASNTGMNDQFGRSVALSGDGNTLAVGSQQEASNATGIDGDQSNNAAATAGAAYVFTRVGATWTQQAYVKASNTAGNDQFGSSVALSSDGNTLAVGAWFEDSAAPGVGADQSNNGASGSGAMYIYSRVGIAWSQQAYIKSSNPGPSDFFGVTSALSADGNTLAVGAYGEASNATGVGGNQSNNSAFAAGAVYVFTRAGSLWAQEAYVKASNTDGGDSFGRPLALSPDGNTLAVGSPNESSNATGIGGNESDNSASSSGAAYVFTRSASVWTQQAYIKASNASASDLFANSLALSSSSLVVGAYGEASSAIGIGGDESNNSVASAGAAYLFVRAGSVWTQSLYIKSSNTAVNQQFGNSVAISADGTTVAVSATGASANTGAVYVY